METGRYSGICKISLVHQWDGWSILNSFTSFITLNDIFWISQFGKIGSVSYFLLLYQIIFFFFFFPAYARALICIGNDWISLTENNRLKGSFVCSQCGTVVKNVPASEGGKGDTGWIPGLGRHSGIGNGKPLQYSCLENTMDRGTWWAIVHRVAKIWTW